VRLILASASPRRQELLARLGLPFEVRPSGIEEPLPGDIPARALATALARAKAADVADRLRGAAEAPTVIVGADTLVVLDGRPLGKPASRHDARRMLRALRGRTHEVVTAVLVRDADAAGHELTETVVSRVVMRAYTDEEIDAYVATGEPDDKAGAYAVQGAGGRLVRRVEGCYTNVVGLPLMTTARLLQAFGLAPAAPDAGRVSS
jgi:nucleoside triphosphate pyrophosphatase